MIGNNSAKATSAPSKLDTPEDYKLFEILLQNLQDPRSMALCREMARTDLYFLLRYVMDRRDMEHPWLFQRCREVQWNPNGHLDLWAREHYKSTIITVAQTIQDVLSSHGAFPDPKWKGRELTAGIFGHTRPIAKAFLRQIKREFEHNQLLKDLFPDILWRNPHKEAPKWSEDDGLVVVRRANQKESTIEAWGLVDSMPTSKHFLLRVYDDVVTQAAVTTPEMMAKVAEAWELSLSLGAHGGIERYIGTRYGILDLYATIIERDAATPRIHPATHDGTEHGRSVFIPQHVLEEKRRKMGAKTFAAQMLQKPISAATATFEIDHLRFTDIRPATLNVAILVDPASSRKKQSDYTSMMVVGIDSAWNRFLLDGVHDRLKLDERWSRMRDLYRKWRNVPGVQSVSVGYERYGMQSDIEYFEQQMKREQLRFDITELAWPKDGPGTKNDRIQRLYPDFASGKWWLPVLVWRDGGLCYCRIVDGEVKFETARMETARMRKMADAGQKWRIVRPIRHKDHEGRIVDVTVVFLTQYLAHPAPAAHDDALDATSRIYDMDIGPPILAERSDLEPAYYGD